MASYYIALSLHILGATIWAGGHLVLATTILPRALRERRAAAVSDFEQSFERIGLPALAVQIVTGLWLAHHLLGAPGNWFHDNPIAHVIQIKLGLLALTLALAIHARLRVVPKLSDDTLPTSRPSPGTSDSSPSSPYSSCWPAGSSDRGSVRGRVQTAWPDSIDAPMVFAALPPGVVFTAADAAEAGTHDQVRLRWDKTPIDIFFAADQFHFDVATRCRVVPFEGGRIKVLSAEDLA